VFPVLHQASIHIGPACIDHAPAHQGRSSVWREHQPLHADQLCRSLANDPDHRDPAHPGDHYGADLSCLDRTQAIAPTDIHALNQPSSGDRTAGARYRSIGHIDSDRPRNHLRLDQCAHERTVVRTDVGSVEARQDAVSDCPQSRRESMQHPRSISPPRYGQEMDGNVTQPAVCARSVSLSLGGSQILKDVDLTIQSGEILAIVGPSGTGKTTLIHVLAGYRTPDAGQVEVQGAVLCAKEPDHGDRIRREQIGFMAQDLDLLEELSSDRNAALPVLLAGGKPGNALRAARALLGDLGMTDHMDRPVRRLSRGQRQRVALARALAHPRPILLLDEPTASLDPATRDLAIGHIKQRAREGAAVLITTHDHAVADQADRVMHLSDGRVEAAS